MARGRISEPLRPSRCDSSRAVPRMTRVGSGASRWRVQTRAAPEACAVVIGCNRALNSVSAAPSTGPQQDRIRMLRCGQRTKGVKDRAGVYEIRPQCKGKSQCKGWCLLRGTDVWHKAMFHKPSLNSDTKYGSLDQQSTIPNDQDKAADDCAPVKILAVSESIQATM